MVNTSSVRVEGSSSPLDFIEHLTLWAGRPNKAHTLRITIHIDGYESQSFGHVERWNGQEWKSVARCRGISLIVDLKVGYVLAFRQADVAHKARYFSDDRNALLKLAEEVL